MFTYDYYKYSTCHFKENTTDGHYIILLMESASEKSLQTLCCLWEMGHGKTGQSIAFAFRFFRHPNVQHYLCPIPNTECPILFALHLITRTKYPIPYAQCPLTFTLYLIANTLYPIPNTQCPIPYTSCQVPNTLYLMPNTLHPIPNTRYPLPKPDNQ